MTALIRSRKFWTLVASVVATATALALGEVNHWQALQALIAAGAAYSLGVAIEGQK